MLLSLYWKVKMKSTIDSIHLINLTKKQPFYTENSIILNNNESLPFEVKRCYYLYNVPSTELRGGHAHKNLYQVIIAASGSFDITVDDGTNKKTYTLNNKNTGPYIIPGIWRTLNNFSPDAVCLVLASELYIENDYIRDYKSFIDWKNNGQI